MQLLFTKPAVDFQETLPIGNGRLGALIYGELMREQVVLNESSMWSGSRQDADRKDAVKYLPMIRSLLREGKNYEAEQVFAEHFTCVGAGSNYAHGSTVPFGCYQLLGRLQISYFQAVSAGRQGCDCVKDYKRKLELETGIVSVSFSLGDTIFCREWIASKEQEALYLHLTASKEGKISFAAGLDRDERFEVEAISEDELRMSGQLEDGKCGKDGIHYACILKASAKGGRVWTVGRKLYVEDADEVLLIITARTNLSGFMGRQFSDAEKQTADDMEQACKKTWEEVKKAHFISYSEQYNALKIDIGEESLNSELPTAERIRRFINQEEEPQLVALYVQYARYLMISCSQKEGLPANLQGIWADEIQTPWNGDWHLNAQQMIYWLVEKTGLSDNHIPYLKLTGELVAPGKKTAQSYYGSEGWLAHTCTNPWGFTSPCENAAWGSTTGSPAWQCHHLWEHYLYTGDSEYLRWAYPIMKGAAQFYLDMLVSDGVNGYLVTSPSSSPENAFLDEEGRICSLCVGPAYDRELIRALFDACIQAQYVLCDDCNFAKRLEETYPLLAPVEISHAGKVLEWGKDYKEAMPYHRHLSHLWGLYPGNQISPNRTPYLAKAAEESLKGRGSTTVGWAIAYRMCLWARLRNAEAAYGYVQDMFRYATAHNLFNLSYHCDETTLQPELPDIENCRYPFQIDGNQGNAAGILLMLLDDEALILSSGEMLVHIYLLPALPKAFARGRVQGLCAKGGLKISMEWKDGKLLQATVNGKAGQRVVIHYEKEEHNITLDNTACYNVFLRNSAGLLPVNFLNFL